MHRSLILMIAVGGCLAAGCATGQTRPDRKAFDDGYAAFQAGQWPRAVDGFTRYLRSDPTSSFRGEVYYYRGEALVHLGRRSESLADFQRVAGAGAPPRIAAFAQVAAGNVYFESGEDARAVRAYAEALKGPQRDLPMDMLLLRLSVSLQRLGKWSVADKYLRHLINRYPKTPAAAEARRRYKADSFSIQTGAYGSLSAAQQENERLRAAGFLARLGEMKRGSQVLHTVQVGRAKDYAAAQTLAQRVAQAGFTALIVP